jgi:serine/threonine protein kinase
MSSKCPECGTDIKENEEVCSCGYEIPISQQNTLMGTPPPVKNLMNQASNDKIGTNTPFLGEHDKPLDSTEIDSLDAEDSDSLTIKDNRSKSSIKKVQDELIGTTLGEFEITEIIGHGGMGTVYGAIHPHIGKKAAIKVLKSSISENKDMMGRFQAEAKAVNAIRHPNIVDIFSFGQIENGSQYLVMEYLEGITFTDYLKENAVIPYASAHAILKQILSALDAAHKKGIIHRDIKPDNIFLEKRPEVEHYVKLLDFGIAKFTEDGFRTSHTKTGVPIGTPFYMSPEQCAGQKVDQQSDIYSIGIILYEMFTGRLPFKGDSFMAILQAHLTKAPFSPSGLVDISAELEAIILWCLKKEKESRPKDIKDLGSKLLPVLQSLAASESNVAPRIIKGATIPDVEKFSISDIGSATLAIPHKDNKKYFWMGAMLSIIVIFGVLVLTGVISISSNSKKDSDKTPNIKPVFVETKPVVVETKPLEIKKVTFQLQISPDNIAHKVYIDGKETNKTVLKFIQSDTHQIEIKVEAEGYLPHIKKYFTAVSVPIFITLKKKELPKPSMDPPPVKPGMQPNIKHGMKPDKKIMRPYSNNKKTPKVMIEDFL